MTIEAKLASCLRGLKRLGVGRSFVARIALDFGHGIMNACFQELCLQGRMRIMAARAGSFAHGIFAVSFFERWPVAVMAGDAERDFPSL
jgi:hypothetical protein